MTIMRSRYSAVMTEITVRGCYATSRAPERAIVSATIGYEGPVMEPVYERVIRDLETVKASVSPLADSEGDAVTWWSADRLRTWSERPRTREGGQLPLAYHVSVGVRVEFGDFTALSTWLGSLVAAVEGFGVSAIEWTLTEAHRDELLSEVRNRAVQDAVTRAQQYADALGLGEIRPVAVADAGMLADIPGSPGGPRFRSAAAVAANAPALELVPRDIEFSVEVDARFTAAP